MTCLRQKRLNLNEVEPQNHGCSIAPDDVVPLRPIKSRLTSQWTTLKKTWFVHWILNIFTQGLLTYLSYNEQVGEFFTRISHKFLNIISWSMVTQLRQGVVLCNELQEHSVSWRFSDRQYRCGSRSGESLHVFELLAFPKSFCRSWGRGTFHHVLLISSHPQASSGRLWREHQISDQIKVSHKQK